MLFNVAEQLAISLMAVAIPVLAGACILGAGLLFDPRVVRNFRGSPVR